MCKLLQFLLRAKDRQMAEKIEFTKMHGIGNDYIYVDCMQRTLSDPAAIAKRVSDRRFGIGGDGLVMILPSERADFTMRMFNADGSEAEMCGNAIRCVGKFVYERGLKKSEKITIETKAGVKTLELRIANSAVESVRVDMGEPILEPAKIPVKLQMPEVVNEPIRILGESLRMTCVSMGNPHAVFFVDKITDRHVLELGPALETFELFPRKINVEFVEVISPKELKMRVWERGSGETFACGTGAAAVMVAAVLNEKTERRAVIHLRGGDLDLEWGEDNHVYKTGPAEFVFDGTVTID